MPTEDDDKRLLLLICEGPATAELAQLEGRLAADPELAARFEVLARAWSALEAPPVPVSSEASARALVRRIRAEDLWSLSLAPRWAQASGAIALVGGIAAGSVAAAPLVAEPELGRFDELTLAESYESMLFALGAEEESGR